MHWTLKHMKGGSQVTYREFFHISQDLSSVVKACEGDAEGEVVERASEVGGVVSLEVQGVPQTQVDNL